MSNALGSSAPPLNTQKNKFLEDQEQVVYPIHIRHNDMHFHQFVMIVRTDVI